MKRHREILQEAKVEIINQYTVFEWERLLSFENKKSMQSAGFLAYCRIKNEVNSVLAPFYQQKKWRKFKLTKYRHVQKTESTMLRNFKRKFGGPDAAIICIGDWTQISQMRYTYVYFSFFNIDDYKWMYTRYKEPTKGKGFRKLFRAAGYQVYLVDEFNTSARCCRCESVAGVTENFKMVNDPRPWKNEMRLCHGLIRCTNCGTKWNRDVNGASNIWKIANAAIQGQARPQYLRRA